ncbi:MAG: PAS domain S-box protein, partial [Janthinobacterium lividum]
TPAFLTGDGEAAALVARFDWSATSLGPITGWSASLRTAVGIIVHSPVPIVMLWGDDGYMIYNDAYSGFAGAKHPGVFGLKVRDGWPEVAEFNDNVMKVGLAGGTLAYRDQELTLHRNGKPEQVWMNLDYSPVLGDDGKPAGVIAIVVETTDRVLSERRQAFRVELADRLAALDDPFEAPAVAAEALGRHLGANRVGYGDVLPDDETIYCDTSFTDGLDPLTGSFTLDVFGPDNIVAQRQGRTFAADDVEDDPNLDHALWRSIGTRAFVSVPLVRDGRFTASLFINQREPRRWTSDEIGLAEEVAARIWDAVERGRAETRLRASEMSLRELNVDLERQVAERTHQVGRTWAINPDLLTIFDAGGRFERANPAWTVMLGWTEAELVGTPFIDLVHPDDVEQSQAAFASLIGGGAPAIDFQNRYRATDGSYRWLSWIAVREDGKCYATARDVTKARQQEAALTQRTAELDRVWRNSRDIHVVVDRDGVFRAVNPAWTAILGHAADEVIGHSFDEFSLGSDGVSPAERFATTLIRDMINIETPYRHKDGSVRWISWNTSVESDLVYGYGRHITDERKAVAALEQSEARMRTLFETSYQLQALLAVDGTVVDVNATALAAIDRTADEIVGLLLCETPWFNGTPDVSKLVCDGVAAAAAGTSVRHEIAVAMASGRRTYDLAIRPIDDAHGNIVAIVAEAVDLTERRLIEEALRQSQKLEAMGQLTGGVAHDFNNLLTPIIGSLDLLQRRAVGGDREQRLLAGALQSADRAKVLVQRRLAFARRQPLQPVAVDVGQLVRDMAGLVYSTSGSRIEVDIDVAKDLPPASADPNQLEMAILNLSVNARDAMAEGGHLRIGVTAETVTAAHPAGLAAGDYIRLSVADTGTGMDAETRTRAVEPFFSTKGVGKGTGLGLSMVHGLTAQLGGALSIGSEPGRGTTIDLWLPVSRERRIAPARRADDRSMFGTALLVDDEELVRASTADMLGELGFRVIEAASAEEALRTIDDG